MNTLVMPFHRAHYRGLIAQQCSYQAYKPVFISIWSWTDWHICGVLPVHVTKVLNNIANLCLCLSLAFSSWCLSNFTRGLEQHLLLYSYLQKHPPELRQYSPGEYGSVLMLFCFLAF